MHQKQNWYAWVIELKVIIAQTHRCIAVDLKLQKPIFTENTINPKKIKGEEGGESSKPTLTAHFIGVTEVDICMTGSYLHK